MKKFLIILAVLLNFSTCAASELEDAELRLICAISSMGAYSDDSSYLMRSSLAERGWTIEKISKKTNRADAKAYLVSKGNVKILTIAGTEKLKDFEVDFRVGRVHLNDNTTITLGEKNPADKIFVHRGFRDYADVVLGDGLAERLKSFSGTLYLTGHSMGGAVATIAAIRLIDSGFDNNRLKVITFGAPAIGSHALAANYADKIDLTRAVLKGDVIKKSLRALGYVQFGKEIKYKQSAASDHFEHKMAVYLDCAIRDYLNAGGTFQHDAPDKISAKIYVAPIILAKGELHKDDKKIILDALDDVLKNNFSGLTFAPAQSAEFKNKKISDVDFDIFVADAKNFGCEYTLIRILRAKKIRDTQSDDKQVTLEEIILDKNGVPLSMQTSGETTENLTIFEAALAVQNTLIDNLKNFFR